MVREEKHILASTELENGNSALVSGDFSLAAKHLNEAFRLALSIDDADMLTRVLFAQISYQAAQNTAESWQSAGNLLAQARVYAARSAGPLAAVCDVYEAYILIFGPERAGAGALSLLGEKEKQLDKEPFYQGFWYHTVGDALVLEKRYQEADAAFVKAADIHTKNRYLEEIGHDWYAAASARSLAGNRQQAVDAVIQALVYDRDAENTVAVASDYFAMARILARYAATDAERKDAASRAEYAAAIYRTIGREDAALECLHFAAAFE
jgi:tetratricopeptide (TPR) repeat protein